MQARQLSLKICKKCPNIHSIRTFHFLEEAHWQCKKPFEHTNIPLLDHFFEITSNEFLNEKDAEVPEYCPYTLEHVVAVDAEEIEKKTFFYRFKKWLLLTFL